MFKAIFFVALISLTHLNASAGDRAHAGESPVETIELSPNEPGLFLGRASWQFDGYWSANVNHTCQRKRWGDWWPLAPTCTSSISIDYEVPFSVRMKNPAAYLFVDKYNKPSVELLVAGETGGGVTQYERLLRQDQPIVTIKELDGYQFILNEFAERSAASLKYVADKEHSEVADERTEIILGAVAAVGVLVALGFALRWTSRKLAKVPEHLKSAAHEVGKLHIRHVVRDEVIRQTTRDALAGASESEKEALRGQIRQALDDGNPALAGTLTSVLEKLESNTTKT